MVRVGVAAVVIGVQRAIVRVSARVIGLVRDPIRVVDAAAQALRGQRVAVAPTEAIVRLRRVAPRGR